MGNKTLTDTASDYPNVDLSGIDIEAPSDAEYVNQVLADDSLPLALKHEIRFDVKKYFQKAGVTPPTEQNLQLDQFYEVCEQWDRCRLQ